MTRLEVGDYERWKPMFDLDAPGARAAALGYRLFRNVDNPNEVFIQIEFASTAAAAAAREQLLSSGVLDRFEDRNGPTVVETAEAVSADLAGPALSDRERGRRKSFVTHPRY